MRLLIQAVLIVAIFWVAYKMVTQRGARTQAVRRLGLVAFAVFASFSVLFPGVWQAMAALMGVGRGADLVLYGLVVAFLAFTVHMFMKFREIENRYTKLARRTALDEAAHAYPEVAAGTANPPLDHDPELG